MEGGRLGHDAWDAWLAASLSSLHEKSLFRVLRPTVPCTSAVQVRQSAAHSLACTKCRSAGRCKPVPWLALA